MTERKKVGSPSFGKRFHQITKDKLEQRIQVVLSGLTPETSSLDLLRHSVRFKHQEEGYKKLIFTKEAHEEWLGVVFKWCCDNAHRLNIPTNQYLWWRILDELNMITEVTDGEWQIRSKTFETDCGMHRYVGYGSSRYM